MTDNAEQFVERLLAPMRAEMIAALEDAYARGGTDMRARIVAVAEQMKRDGPPSPKPAQPDVVFADAALLEPISAKQAKIFETILGLTKSYGHWCYGAQIAKKSGYGNIFDAVSTLVERGYIVAGGDRGARKWRAIADGVPRIVEAPNARRWTEEEFDTLRATAEGDGDYEALSGRIGRSIEACEQQARARGWYRNPGIGRWPDEAEPPALLTSVTHTENVEKSPENDDTADLDDLTKSSRDVLLALSAAGDNSDNAQVAALAETPADRVPAVLLRLYELKLSTRETGKWALTDAGHAMALRVKEDEHA